MHIVYSYALPTRLLMGTAFRRMDRTQSHGTRLDTNRVMKNGQRVTYNAAQDMAFAGTRRVLSQMEIDGQPQQNLIQSLQHLGCRNDHDVARFARHPSHVLYFA